MEKLFIEDLSIEGKKVIMRVDFNVPLDGEGNVTDATRIEAALPSIRYVIEKGGALILMSHLGRPRNEPNPALSLKPVAKVLEALIERPVKMASDCIGEEVREAAMKLKKGEVLLLENLRFHRAETHPDEDRDFAKELASLADLYVNDAFGAAHRKHSSTYAITSFFPGKAAAGYLLEKEIRFLGKTLQSPKRPFYALLGGAKISTKIGVVKSLLQKADRLLIGGGMAYTFLKARGHGIGKSLFEPEFLELAKDLLKEGGEKIILPRDAIAAQECSEEASIKLIDFSEGDIPEGYEAFDIGPKTIERFSHALSEARTVMWNGPVGVYELERFAKGTKTLAARLGELDADTIVGGGDLIAALKETGMSENITHLSTGGGATLEFLEQGTLPCIEALSEKNAGLH
ncbi:MAG: phosphoglycerate kinase [Chlamydiales bacterium]|nr:phosphoglycerate kinase [Chlamydiales bacterium]